MRLIIFYDTQTNQAYLFQKQVRYLALFLHEANNENNK